MATDSTYEIALRFLAKREHTNKELFRKLSAKGIEEDAIEETLATLEAEGLLSHERFAESYVNHRIFAGYGPRRIAEELKERGLEPALVTRYLWEAMPQEIWEEHLKAAWEKKFNAKKPQDAKTHMKQYRFLVQRGFEPERIAKLLRK